MVVLWFDAALVGLDDHKVVVDSIAPRHCSIRRRQQRQQQQQHTSTDNQHCSLLSLLSLLLPSMLFCVTPNCR